MDIIGRHLVQEGPWDGIAVSADNDDVKTLQEARGVQLLSRDELKRTRAKEGRQAAYNAVAAGVAPAVKPNGRVDGCRR
jgi:hypothetical protein